MVGFFGLVLVGVTVVVEGVLRGRFVPRFVKLLLFGTRVEFGFGFCGIFGHVVVSAESGGGEIPFCGQILGDAADDRRAVGVKFTCFRKFSICGRVLQFHAVRLSGTCTLLAG